MKHYASRERPYKVGDVVRIRMCTSHVIPAGLTEGVQVRVSKIDTGTVEVEYQGRRFEVPMVLIDNGIDYEVNGRWTPQRPRG